MGELLRHWRELRRLTQLELASQAEVSSRHLSFVETGRSVPSRQMILHLAEHLDLPLRERNELLLAGGFAPIFGETSLDAPEMSLVRTALRQVLAGHEPYPALLVDRDWNLVEANASLSLFTGFGAPELLTPPVNVLRLALHPDGMASRIVNLGEWRSHLLSRLRRRVAMTANPDLTRLYEELLGYPCDQPEPPPPSSAGELVMPLRLRHGDRELAFFCTIATFGTPLDVTLAELAIETFFPANASTAATLREIQRRG